MLEEKCSQDDTSEVLIKCFNATTQEDLEEPTNLLIESSIVLSGR